MFIVNQPTVAISLCLLTMLCWGSWTNGQKLVTQSAPLAVFYRDYVCGIGALALVLAFTLGSFGADGRSFLADLQQATRQNLLLALAGGLVFNAGNTLLTVGISQAGIAIAMPVGTGLSLALGLVVNYLAEPRGSMVLLAIGGGVVLASIVCSALAYRAKETDTSSNGANRGIWIALAGGLIAGFFFRIIASTLSEVMANPDPGKLTPYTGFLIFSLGILLSNPGIEWLIGRFGLIDREEQPTYRAVRLREHGIGLASGLLWGLGMMALLLGATQAGDAVSFGLSQGATIVSVLWGLFVWDEFKGTPPEAKRYLWLMGVTYVAGLVLIVLARA